MNLINPPINAISNRQILLVDDDLLLHKLLAEYLLGHHYHLHTLPNGEGISNFCQHQQPDIILLDIMMPGEDGIHWLKWLKANHPTIPVMLLSAKKSAQERLQGLEVGADDYLTKPFHPKELLIRMHNIMRHQPVKHIQTIKIGSNVFDPEQEKLERDNTIIKLTAQETSLLRFLCQNAGQILTRDAISHAINGNDYHPLNRSIDMTINRLRKKLGDDAHSPQYLRTIWRKGYRLTLNT
ncbi:two-component system, OmpR family, phosphate regulon response regulator OmpR [Thiothrix caldifontis]|uniref:Two-component system, OmpR family, phosphate regulon response regulator OmpR n=1 Tax=Thiothrix caldifontis TaxID=525918 RepID=A0A1H3Z380_9GAMM|nr:response regulator transcription factor [Thiothrix caldifontis]SEA18229.1 two-component system, OmpR family, phosphate regulon response regulator OmpR [Thiothrix caldifontis]